MNKSELVTALQNETGLNKKEAELLVSTFFDEIIESLKNDSRTEIRGFGSFSVKKYKSYTGRNPKTGEHIRVASKKLPVFKVGKELKEKVDY
jgi:integration host factor subunit beta